MLKQLRRLWAPRPAAGPLAGSRRQLDPLLVEVHRMEVEAGCTDPVSRARLWNQIAAIAGEAGDHAHAKEALGRALDAYIEAGRYDAAVSLCRRLLERYPTVVRAHCTLALLYVARRDLGDAIAAIHAYAEAASRSSTEPVAIARLMLVANLAGDGDVRSAAMQAMERLASPGVWRTLRRYLSGRAGAASLKADARMGPLDLALLNQSQVRDRMVALGGSRAAEGEAEPVPPRPAATAGELPMLERDHWY